MLYAIPDFIPIPDYRLYFKKFYLINIIITMMHISSSSNSSMYVSCVKSRLVVLISPIILYLKMIECRNIFNIYLVRVYKIFIWICHDGDNFPAITSEGTCSRDWYIRSKCHSIVQYRSLQTFHHNVATGLEWVCVNHFQNTAGPKVFYGRSIYNRP